MINGSPTDPNAADFKAGAHSVLDGKVNIGKEYDTPDWSPDQAQTEMEQAITALGKDKIIGVYAANDGTAGGAIAAMKGAGFTTLPPITGQDAELAAIQRIISRRPVHDRVQGDQAGGGHRRADGHRRRHRAAVHRPADGQRQQRLDRGCPSVLLNPVAVTKANIKDTVIKDGFYTAGADLHRAVRRGVQGRRHLLTTS